MVDAKVLDEKASNYLCVECKSKNNYKIMPNEIKMFRNGITYSYTELIAVCNKCKSEIYIPYLNDFNILSQRKSYNTALNKSHSSLDSRMNNSNTMSYKEAADRIEHHMVVHKLKERSRALKITEALSLAIKLLRMKEVNDEICR